MDLEAEYNNRARVPEHPRHIEGWARDAAAYRETAHFVADVRYGDHPRQTMDVFCPSNDAGRAIAVFVHGGYWQGLDNSHFSHMAGGLNEHGLTVAVPSYRLCPEVAIGDIIDDIREVCLALWRKHERRLVVGGHSAGGHLAAAMLATDWTRHDAPQDLVLAGFGISGLYDLRPLIPTTLNGALKLDEPMARCVSPLLWPTPAGRRFETWVGASESDEFRRQSRTLAAAWNGGGAPTTYVEEAGADHFSVLAPLADADSAMTRAWAGLCKEGA